MFTDSLRHRQSAPPVHITGLHYIEADIVTRPAVAQAIYRMSTQLDYLYSHASYSFEVVLDFFGDALHVQFIFRFLT